MTFTDEPEVITWMIALAPQPRRQATGRHWWRELVTDTFRCANQAWELQREAVAIGYPAEEAEYAQAHPRPTLKAAMRALSTGAMAPESIGRPTAVVHELAAPLDQLDTEQVA